MFIIIGLGNPGIKYLGTRHNLGFEYLDKLQTEWKFPDFQLEKKFNAEISKGQLNKQDVLLVKPQTFMNLSGQAILSLLHFYKVLPENISVLHDDLDLPIGTFRLAEDSRSAGHNGVQNIIDLLGTQKFKRIRIGIGNHLNSPEDSPTEITAKEEVFVLQKLSLKEREQIEKIFPEVLEKIKEII
ncbi:aminoacyl-tRNA hydrolase [Patescibacteria group bacterium]|nr:aminoacyl-tRNA hydrolase [Patescibacteria group bacterium]